MNRAFINLLDHKTVYKQRVKIELPWKENVNSISLRAKARTNERLINKRKLMSKSKKDVYSHWIVKGSHKSLFRKRVPFTVTKTG